MRFPTRRAGVLAIAACLAGAQACSDAPLDPPVAARTTAQPADPAEPLVRALARALAEPSVRRRLFEDLRDSPFKQHKLHLQSYLRGASGQAVLAAGAKATGQSQAELQALLRTLPQMEIAIPIELHRLRWTGTPEVTVVGSALSRQEIGRRAVLNGYTTGGRAVSIHANARPKEALIALWPTEHDFGADPEAVRRNAPRKERSSVSTMSDEFSQCDDVVVREACGEPGGGGGVLEGGLVIPSGNTYQCMVAAYAGGDNDGDGVLDSCETEIAHAFRPYLALAANDFDTRREEYWSGMKGDTQYSVRIFYALSYHNDGGDPETEMFKSTSHQGDSEFIMIQVSYSGSRWRMDRAKLSAHWGTWTNSSEVVGYSELEYPDGIQRGRMRSWAARNKHANYKSRSACDAGAYWADTCDGNYHSIWDAYYSVEALPTANLGNSWNHDPAYGFKDCVYSREGQPWNRIECYWSSAENFFGWQPPSSVGAGPYRESLIPHGF